MEKKSKIISAEQKLLQTLAYVPEAIEDLHKDLLHGKTKTADRGYTYIEGRIAQIKDYFDVLRRKFKKPEYLNAVRKYHKENLNFLKRPVLMRQTGVLLAPLTKDHLSDPLYAHTIPPLSDLTTTRRGGRRALFQTQSRFKVIKQGKRDRRSNYDICRELDSQNCPTPVTWECKRWTFAYKNDPKLRLRIHKMFHKA